MIIVTKKSYYMILLVMPPILFLLYTFIYDSQALHNIPIAVWDEDHTNLSRVLTNQYQSSPLVQISEKVDTKADVKKLMQENKIQGAVHIPKNFESDIKSSKGSTVTFYRNSSNLIYDGLLYKVFAEVTLTVNGGIVMKMLSMQGVNPHQAKTMANPVSVHTHSMYNPSYNYQNYLVPGLITVGLQMMIIMICVLLINSELEDNTISELLELSGNSAFKIIAGKTLAHYLVGMINVVLIFGIFFTYFNIPYVHAFGKLFVLFSILILACIGIGIMISIIFSETLMASDLALFYTSPAFVFSGFTFPKWAMPWYDQIYANLMPYTPFLIGFFKVYQMDASWKLIAPHLLHMFWFIAIPFSVAWAVLKIKLSKKKLLVK
jgi:ABC-2 type transport system permease protein